MIEIVLDVAFIVLCMVTAAICCGTALATRRSLDDLDTAVAELTAATTEMRAALTTHVRLTVLPAVEPPNR